MKVDFSLTKKLSVFMELVESHNNFEIGEKYPVSIHRRYRHGQTLVIFPDGEYPFFLWSELLRVGRVCEVLGLDMCVSSNGNVAVIEVTDYSLIGK